MSRSLILTLPDDIDRSLDAEVRLTGRSREEVAVAWLKQHVSPQERGTVSAMLPFFGAWSLSADERRTIEELIATERDREDERD
jgi:hypothetical protein